MAFLKEVKTTVRQKNGTRLNGNRSKKVHRQKDWDSSPPPQIYFDELRRVSKEQIIFGVEYVDWQGLGNGRIKWNKGVAEGMSFKGYEMAYCSLIDEVIDLDLLWSGMNQAKSLSEPMTQQGNKKLNEARIHPTQKPILLYDWIFKTFARSGMRILDTHLGSGGIRISADKFKLDFVGIELDAEYFNLQEYRWATYKSQLQLF
jgi:site-specific DNA-methyltransferase (adenine-specific)